MKSIPLEVLEVLAAGRCEGSSFFLGEGQLERKLYTKTNKVLSALGGKWNRKAKAHLFDGEAADRLEPAIASGSYSCPADLGYFPTPKALAELMASELARSSGGQGRILEPSAGGGGLIRALAEVGFDLARVDAVELDTSRAFDLARDFPDARHLCASFEACSLDPPYDLVIMNPPFAKGADVRHVTIALELLSEGGALRAIVSSGVVWREQRAQREFRELIESLGGTIEQLPDESFKASGTMVRTALVRVG